MKGTGIFTYILNLDKTNTSLTKDDFDKIDEKELQKKFGKTTKLVKTYLGNGQFEKISLSLLSRMAKCTLKYDTYANE